jgi:hypothetical protein
MTFLRIVTPALSFCWSMIFSENRNPIFGIMLYHARSARQNKSCASTPHQRAIAISRAMLGMESGAAGRRSLADWRCPRGYWPTLSRSRRS